MRWKERCFVKSLSSSTLPSNAVQPANDSFHDTTNDEGMENHYTGSGYGGFSGGGDGGDAGDTGEDEHITTFDDSSCGLTISGFYYVCLRRSDGRLEGLYYDPQSSPYQCLKLESLRGGFPAWGFR